MTSHKISISVSLIIIFFTIFVSNDSQFSEQNKNSFKTFDDFKENDLKHESTHFEGRATGPATMGNLDGMIGQFWQTLYINRGFNSSFVLLLPLFTVTIPGYGRGLEHQTPLSALNIGL